MKLPYIFSLNTAFTDIQWHDINEKAVRAEIMQILIHGHSLYDEVAFYELYVSGQISSKEGLDHFLQQRIPEFPGKVTSRGPASVQVDPGDGRSW